MSAEEFVIRDFDAHCYHHGDLYRDIRNLYNHFIEDYYAFIEYNGLKDGQDIKRLKELVNKIAKSVGEKNDKFKYDSGTDRIAEGVVSLNGIPAYGASDYDGNAICDYGVYSMDFAGIFR